MASMKQSSAVLNLRTFMDRDDGWGNAEGREVHQRLLKAVESNPGKTIFQISLKGVQRTDASFPRESVLQLARRFRCKKGFCLVDVTNPDLIDNWDAAASKSEQPLTLWSGTSPQIIGPRPTRGNEALLEFMLSVAETTASEAAKQMRLNLTNVSTKLKQLHESGFVMRYDDVSPTGGIEYRYSRIG